MGRASDKRRAKVQSLLRRTLSEIIRDELSDPRVELFSISDLQVSRDLAFADVKVTAIGGREATDQCCAALSGAIPLLWNRLRTETDLRIVPQLRFFPDHGGDYQDEIEHLLTKIPRPAGEEPPEAN